MASNNYHYIYQLSHCNNRVFQKSNFGMLIVDQQGLVSKFLGKVIVIGKHNYGFSPQLHGF